MSRPFGLGMVTALLWISPIAHADLLHELSSAELMRKLALSRYPAGTQAPEFRGCCYRGEEVSLAELRGRVVLVDFWATWCITCRRDMPALERLHRELSPEGLSVIGINLRQRRAVIERYGKKLDLSFPLLSDPQGTIQAAYGVVGTPTTFLIDREGQAVALAVGGRPWNGPLAREIIGRLLAEPPESLRWHDAGRGPHR